MEWQTAEDVAAAWMRSKRHSANPMNLRYPETGIGIARTADGFVAAQVFATAR